MNYPTVYTALAGCPIHLVGKTGQAVQISIHYPSQYICANREQILPDWKKELSLWVVIVLQQSAYELVESTPEIEAEKERLREKFMRFGCDVAFNLRDGTPCPPLWGDCPTGSGKGNRTEWTGGGDCPRGTGIANRTKYPPQGGDRSYLTDLIDPRTGYPLLSRPGKILHDDTAAVKALLRYPVIQNKCRVLIHPSWGMAVYPGILLSQAPPLLIEWVIRSIAPLHGWKMKTED